jgi:hypothetical protein
MGQVRCSTQTATAGNANAAQFLSSFQAIIIDAPNASASDGTPTEVKHMGALD